MSALNFNQQLLMQNAAMGDWIKRNAVMMFQPVAPGAVSGTVPGQVVNVQLRNVGFVRRLIIEVTGTITNAGAETQYLTKLGLSNIFSNVTLTDLSNQTRINTPSWHLHMVSTAKRGLPFGAAYQTDSPVAFGSNLKVMNGPAAIAGAAQTFRWFVEVPCMVGPNDLRGGIYANVVNATFQLQFTFNSNFFLTSSQDETLGVYKSSSLALATLSNVSYVVYQDYYDQIPNGKDGKPLLPPLDISTAYLLNQTALTGLTALQDYPVTYANNREFLSTMLIYDNAAMNAGTDINYFSLQVANYTNVFRYNDPFVQSFLNGRNMIGEDWPAGCYYFDHRLRPIETIQYGNQELIVNPSDVQSGARLLVGFESTAIINQLIQAGSLPAGG